MLDYCIILLIVAQNIIRICFNQKKLVNAIDNYRLYKDLLIIRITIILIILEKKSKSKRQFAFDNRVTIVKKELRLDKKSEITKIFIFI